MGCQDMLSGPRLDTWSDVVVVESIAIGAVPLDRAEAHEPSFISRRPSFRQAAGLGSRPGYPGMRQR
jgi:hypothetical protein